MDACCQEKAGPHETAKEATLQVKPVLRFLLPLHLWTTKTIQAELQ